MTKKQVLVLGASGTIGKKTIDIIRHHPELFSLAGVSVHSNTAELEKLKAEFGFKHFAITNPALAAAYPPPHNDLQHCIANTPADVVINGIAGAAGLPASLHALASHPVLGLANKESIVMAGDLLYAEAQKHGAVIVPVDSEHSALYHLIKAHGKANIAQLILTASGGPFRTWSAEKLKTVRLADALQHPTWAMGQKITIDSASLANKALEVIEAAILFDMPVHRITVTIHPTSVVHSLVQLTSGETYAQLSPPDMRNPIFAALTYPDLPPAYLQPLDFTQALDLHFEPPRTEAFPLLTLGFFTAQKKAAYPIAFNAANEQAVAAFLNGRVQFIHLADITRSVLQHDWSTTPQDLAAIMQADRQARTYAEAYINSIGTQPAGAQASHTLYKEHP
ncbi:MAG: 1-deoxy-D-xylulose-5-phosphate reductoisomerase [Treponema sp.]